MRCEENCTCACCDGVQATTPVPIYNRPGLDALVYRVGEHGSFLETMKARLSSSEFPALAGLGARTPDDPSIALLDGWATVADVLTFYQERLANEGYLRTATERRSVLELARLIGYAPRPGVAATVYLAYELDKSIERPAEIPAGSRVQSLPGPGELPQTFETVEKFTARKEWNAIKPRLEQPHALSRLYSGTDTSPGARVFLKGTNTGLKPNDVLLIQVDIKGRPPQVFRVSEVVPDSAADRTMVRFKNWDGSEVLAPSATRFRRALRAFEETPPSLYPANSLQRMILEAALHFLAWFHEQIAKPRHPAIELLLSKEYVVTVIVSRLEELRQIATASVSYWELVNLLFRSIGRMESFIGAVAEGVEGKGDFVMAEASALVDRLVEIASGAAERPPGPDEEGPSVSVAVQRILTRLAVPRSVPPRNSQSLERDALTLFDPSSDIGAQAVAELEPQVATELSAAMRNAKVTADVPIHVFAFRQRSLLFGNAAPPKVTAVRSSDDDIEEWSDDDINKAESRTAVDLDLPQAKVASGSWIVLDYSAIGSTTLGGIKLPTDTLLLARAGLVQEKLARASYGISGQTTRIALRDPDNRFSREWFTYEPPKPEAPRLASGAALTTPPEPFHLIRRLVVYAGSEELPLAMEPMDEPICGGDQLIEVDGLYSGLETGRWVVVSGERADVPNTEGVRGSELVMLDAVQQRVRKFEPEDDERRLLDASRPEEKLAADARPRALMDGPPPPPFTYEPGERLHTFLKFATPLSYCYKRSTVTFNANVVKATHGETRTETLGSGDASTPLQRFTLRQPPLTFVPANEPDGVASTLRVYVNGVEWHEAEAMVALGPTDRGFVTRTDDDGKTSIVFGDGQRGARLPTGVENVKALYRGGIGKAGNVKAGQITQLLSRPLGVKGVTNPMEASGGADRETRDQARKNAPLAVMALDRLVSVRDYADFSRTFAGIAKAASARFFTDGQDGVHVTIAGIDDITIPPSSDLYANLIAALRTYGDPSLAVHVQARELLMLVLSARVSIHEDYPWEDVVERVRAGLLERYSFERQELGQSIIASEVIAFIQNQRGVRYVDLEALGAVSQLDPEGNLRSPQDLATELRKVIETAARRGRPDAIVPIAGIRRTKTKVLPAQLAFLVPSLPETLILNRLED